MSNMSLQNLRNQCHTFFSSSPPRSAEQDFSEMADWCLKHNIRHNSYGVGKLIQSFENKVAKLLGFEAGCFVMTTIFIRRENYDYS